MAGGLTPRHLLRWAVQVLSSPSHLKTIKRLVYHDRPPGWASLHRHSPIYISSTSFRDSDHHEITVKTPQIPVVKTHEVNDIQELVF
jgi:hypothetical protein